MGVLLKEIRLIEKAVILVIRCWDTTSSPPRPIIAELHVQYFAGNAFLISTFDRGSGSGEMMSAFSQILLNTRPDFIFMCVFRPCHQSGRGGGEKLGGGRDSAIGCEKLLQDRDWSFTKIFQMLSGDEWRRCRTEAGGVIIAWWSVGGVANRN